MRIANFQWMVAAVWCGVVCVGERVGWVGRWVVVVVGGGGWCAAACVAPGVSLLLYS